MQEALCILGIHAFGKRRLWHKKVFEAGRKAKKLEHYIKIHRLKNYQKFAMCAMEHMIPLSI